MLKRELKELEWVKCNLEKAVKYLMSDDIYICTKSNGTTTLDFKNKDKYIYPVNKEVGSDLCGLFNGLSIVEGLINANSKAPRANGVPLQSGPDLAKPGTEPNNEKGEST